MKLWYDPDLLTNRVEITRFEPGTNRIIAPNWCWNSLVRVEVSFLPDAAPSPPLQNVTASLFRYFRTNNYDLAPAGVQTIATIAEVTAAQTGGFGGVPTLFGMYFDARNFSQIVFDTEATTLALNQFVVTFSVPPTPVVPAPVGKDC